MPKLGDIIAPKAQTSRIQATNKVTLENGWYDGKIVDVWIFNVDADGKYTKERTDEKKCEIKVALLSDGEETGYVLSRRMRAYLSKGSQFGKVIESLTGLAAGSDEQREFDTDSLVGMPVEVQTVQNGEYVNIEAFKPVKKAASLAPKAAPKAAVPASRTTPVHHDDAGSFDESWPDERR